MRRYLIILMGVFALACWQWAPVRMAGQSRRRVTITDPGTLSRVGSGGSYAFRTYSYGFGSLGRGGSSASGRGRLQSSVRDRATPSSTVRGGASPAALPPSPPTVAQAARRYTPTKGLTAPRGRGPDREPYSAGLGMTTTYLEAILPSPSSTLGPQDEPITSLVPREPSVYRTRMDNADKAFRSGDYGRAMSQYEVANLIAGRSNPESLLGMMHASLASSRGSFHQAGGYLRQTLRYLPELPLLPLDPRGFYGSVSPYGDDVARLKAHVETHSYDSDALLLLTYFYWFEGNHPAAHRTLAKCASVAHTKRGSDAVNAFWDGMLASGKVSGEISSPPLRSTPPPDTSPSGQPR